MGLENEVYETACRSNKDLDQLRTMLKGLGWQEVNFGFNLGRHSEALDVQKKGERRLVYPSSHDDQIANQLLTDHDIARLGSNYICPNQQLTIVTIPLEARALDSMTFPDQQPTTGYLGSYDIMVAAARLLAKIFKKTSYTPQNLKLNQLALIAGEDYPVRLIPPITLVQSSEWDELADALLQDLNLQNPQSNHIGQIEIFKTYFADFLRHD